MFLVINANIVVYSIGNKWSYYILNERLFAEAPRKQNQLTDHLKLKPWSRKQRGRPRGRHVGVKENSIRTNIFFCHRSYMLICAYFV